MQLGPTSVSPVFTTSSPGFGISSAKFGGVAHPFPMFALNISGRLASPDPPLPVIVTAAQFMYISRFPKRLNHVQANIAGPAFALAGTVNG